MGVHTKNRETEPPSPSSPAEKKEVDDVESHRTTTEGDDDDVSVEHSTIEYSAENLSNEAKKYMESVATFKKTFGDRQSMHEKQELAMQKKASFFDISGDVESLKTQIKVCLEFRDLTYTVFSKKKGLPCCGKQTGGEPRVILDSVTGHVPSSRLMAIMGPTGCGKTSLINALAGRLQVGGTLEGDILVNGKPREKSFMALVAYVMQDDVLFANLTVQETFEFASRMRLPRSIPQRAKDELVDRIIKELGLTKARNTRIGNELYRGVSGGERKRTNIGIELLSGASLIFLDEPTSGLDSFQALNVMDSLWTLAANGRTIVSTIHQPRSSIFKMFDILLLLSEGKCMYFGPAKDAVNFFMSAHFSCPAEFNPADFFLDVISMDYRSKAAEVESRNRVSLIAKHYEKVEDEYRGKVPADRLNAECTTKELVIFPNDPFTEFGLLLKRSWKQQSRDKLPLMITLVQTIVIGFVLAALYSNLDSSSTPVQDETGILFFVTIFSAFGAMFSALNTFPSERGVVNRERQSKMYHVLPYYCARFICDIPIRVGQGLLFGCIVYFIVGLNPAASAFFIFCCILIVEGLAAQGMGVCISAVAPNEKVASALAPAITVILILVGGFYVNEATVPDWIGWLKYISHLYWAFLGLSINNFSGRTGWRTCASTIDGQCVKYTTVTGDEILEKLGFNPSQLWLSFVALVSLMAFYNAMGYIFLRRSKQKTMPLTDIATKKRH